IMQFSDAAAFLTHRTTMQAAEDAVFDNIVFEGAQGLLLDEYHRFFPHVTRSRTGLANVVDLCQAMGDIDRLDVYYVIRPYMTRHGEGPFPSYDPDMSFPDPTNHPNPWQGTLRFGALDV